LVSFGSWEFVRTAPCYRQAPCGVKGHRRFAKRSCSAKSASRWEYRFGCSSRGAGDDARELAESLSTGSGIPLAMQKSMRWTMLNSNSKQRALLADKLFDIANVAAGGMIFGQFVAERRFSVLLAAIGIAIWVFVVSISIVISGRRRS
jgi:hypothetical protein